MKIKISNRNSEKTLSFAEKELVRYLEQILEGSEGVFSVSLQVDPKLDPLLDAFCVCMNADGGEIKGSNERSVLLGVYDYLHHIGCRFLHPYEGGEVVPHIDKSALKADYEKHASFRHRGVCIEGANTLQNILDFIDWLPKVGYNSFFLQFRVPYIFLSRWYHHEKNPYREAEVYTLEDAIKDTGKLEAAMEERGLILHKVGHGWTGEVLGETTVGSWNTVENRVPEGREKFAALIDGKRGFYMGIPANTNLCLSNPETVEEFARIVVKYAKENRTVDYLHVWLADEYNNVCECEACVAGTISDHYVTVLNEIDRRLTEEGLDTRIVFLLYQELLWPPVKARLKNPDRFLLMFAPISRTFERSYDLSDIAEEIPQYIPNHITLPTNLSENLAFLRGWQEQFAGEGFVYDYPLGRAHYGDFGYVHISRIISQDIKKLDQMGLDGYISCQELRVAMPNMLPNYVMGYTLFNKEVEPEELINEYFAAAYPGAPEVVKEFLEQLSSLSSCDYLNGKGERRQVMMAERFTCIAELCQQTKRELEKRPSGGHWDTLRYHCDYIRYLALALEALAHGEEAVAAERYREMRQFICEGEPEYQPYLDVYRILEVTQKYTGFGKLLQDH